MGESSGDVLGPPDSSPSPHFPPCPVLLLNYFSVLWVIKRRSFARSLHPLSELTSECLFSCSNINSPGRLYDSSSISHVHCSNFQVLTNVKFFLSLFPKRRSGAGWSLIIYRTSIRRLVVFIWPPERRNRSGLRGFIKNP